MMNNYVFLAEFKNKIYSSIHRANDKHSAFKNWLVFFINQPFVSKMQREHILREDDPLCQIENTCNVWRWYTIVWGKSLCVEFTDVVEFNAEDDSFIYTFLMYLDGGTYIYQGNLIDFKSSYNQWLSYTLNADYINDSQKRFLGRYHADIALPIMEKTKYLNKLQLCEDGISLMLFIAKTRIQERYCNR